MGRARTRAVVLLAALLLLAAVLLVSHLPAHRSAAALASRGVSKPPVGAPVCPLVPRIPDGWYVSSAAPEGEVPPGDTFTLFGNLDDRGRLRGPALAVGMLGNLDILPGGLFPSDRRELKIGRRSAVVHRSGRYVRLQVAGDGQDIAVLFAGRDLSVGDIVAAARRTSFGGTSVRVDPGGIPDGLHELVTAPIGPMHMYGFARTFSLVDGAEQRIFGDVRRASRPARALQRLWLESFADTDPDVHAAVVEHGADVVAVVGDAPKPVLKQIAESARCDGPEGWARFRARMADVPARLVLRGDVGDEVFANGTDSGVHWAVAFAVRSAIAGTGPTALIGSLEDPDRESGALISFPETPQLAVITSLDVDSGTVVAGYLPATATRLDVIHPDGASIRTMILDTGPDPSLRYFVAFVPPIAGPPRVGLVTTATALDASGNPVGYCNDLGFSCRPGR